MYQAALVGLVAVVLLAGHAQATSCTADADCMLGGCRTGFCCLFSDGCSTCDDAGTCTACEATHQMLVPGLCTMPTLGENCAADAECTGTNMCRGGHCCAAADEGCVDCGGSYGLCSQCRDAYTLTSGLCVPNGAASASITALVVALALSLMIFF